ncbi:ABC transporter ATP-binding protein [Spirosoma arcticum]
MNKNLNALLRVLGPYGRAYAVSALLLMASMAARSLEPKVLQVLVDNVYVFLRSGGKQGGFAPDFGSQAFYGLLPALTPDNLNQILMRLAVIYLLIAFVRGGFLFASSAMKESSTEQAIKRLRDRMFAHIQRVPLQHLATVSKGELVQRCTGDIDTVRNFFRQQINAVFRLSFMLLFSFVMMCTLNWPYALISVMLIPVIGLLGYVFFNREQKIWQQHEAEADRLSNMVQENLNGIRAVAAFANEQYEIERFDRQNRRKRAMGLKQVSLHSLYHPLSDFLVNLQITISVLAGGYLALTQRITIGELLGFFAYVTQIAWPMREIGRLLSQLGMAFVAMERIADILDAPVEQDTDAETVGHLNGDIAFSHVTFRYTPDAEPALHDVSFYIRAGEKIALIGPTGSGKSTIIKLLLRLYEPNSGEIRLDGQTSTTYARGFLRQRIGVALQKAFLFSTTIQGNIAYTRPEAPLEAVDDAARTAQAHEMKHKFPAGYQTVVGENGVTLSGGQKQRVALARTLLAGPDILVLDDTTSAVDAITEHAIFEALAEPMQGKTTIIISHRIASIQQAHRIFVLENGRIVQQGTADELARQPGYYQQIYQIQSAEENTLHV